jgi:hypothetical protein
MLKFPIPERQEINLVFKIKVFVVSKIWYFNKSIYFYFPKIWGCYNRVNQCSLELDLTAGEQPTTAAMLESFPRRGSRLKRSGRTQGTLW